MKRIAVLALAPFLLCAGCVSSGSHGHATRSETAVRELLELNWIPVKLPRLPPGVHMALKEGDLAKPGPIVFYFYMPPHYVLPAHYHDTAEAFTTVSGVVYLGGMDGHPFDRAVGKAHPAGSMHELPAHTTHWAFTNDDSVVVEVHTTGPYTFHWVEAPQ